IRVTYDGIAAWNLKHGESTTAAAEAKPAAAEAKPAAAEAKPAAAAERETALLVLDALGVLGAAGRLSSEIEARQEFVWLLYEAVRLRGDDADTPHLVTCMDEHAGIEADVYTHVGEFSLKQFAALCLAHMQCEAQRHAARVNAFSVCVSVYHEPTATWRPLVRDDYARNVDCCVGWSLKLSF